MSLKRVSLSCVPPQRERAELLDLNCGSFDEARRSLHDLRRINTLLGGTRVSLRAVFSMLQNAGEREASVLDIGCGAGDFALQLQREAARRKRKLRVVGLDLNARHLQVAREALPAEAGVLLLRADAFRLPFADHSFDVVHSSLFLHHFRPRQVRLLLEEFSRVARVGWVMNDLARHGLPLWFFRTTWPLYAHSRLTRLDGVTSIRRAYTKTEMQNLLADFAGARVAAKFPFRWCATWTRENYDGE